MTDESELECAHSGNVSEKDDDIYQYPLHRRLTFISMNACDFCDKVETPGPYMYYISLETKNGWVACSNPECKKKGEAAVEYYMRTQSYGKANHLRGKRIRVKRTSGAIEDTWTLSTIFVEPILDYSGVERVCVVNETGDVEKWVNVLDLLEWNA